MGFGSNDQGPLPAAMMERAWTGVILAGGQSRRMGYDKALMEVDGKSMLERGVELLRPHVREVLVIGDPSKYAPSHATVLSDERPGLGPLGGIVTALKRARYVRCLVLACDLPVINDRLLVNLKKELDKGADAVVPRHQGSIEPLAAAYHRRTIDAFEQCLQEKVLKMSAAIDRVGCAYLDIEPGKDGWPSELFRNLNTPADL